MPSIKKPLSTNDDRRRARRDRALRTRGLRPITIWIRDTSSPTFRVEAEQQIERVRNGAAEREFAEVWAPNQDKTGWVWDD